MKTVAKKFYLITLVFVLIMVLSVFFEFKFSESSLRKEIGKSINIKADYINEAIEREFSYRAEVIRGISSYLGFEEDEEKIEEYLRKVTEESGFFSSVYFGMPSNKMINGSGWQPPKAFDLRKRPWYTKALSSDEIIYTDAFLNASKTNVVITIASKVTDNNGNFIGVVAGDAIVENIFDLVIEKKISENGFSFLIDSEGSMLVSPQSSKKDMYYSLNIAGEYEEAISLILKNKDKGILPITIKDQNGYLVYRQMKNTGWVAASFTPTKDHIDENKRTIVFIIVSLIFSFFIFIILFFTYNSYLVKPMLTLEKEVELIKEEDNFEYRLKERGIFSNLRRLINKLLDSKQRYFDKMIENQDKLSDINDELEASLGQLIAIENELRNKYDELLESRKELAASEERHRAIVTTLPDIVFRIDSNGVFIDCQANDESQLIAKKEYFIGRRIEEVMPESIAKQGMLYIEKAIKTKKLQEYDYALEMGGKINYFEVRMVSSGKNEVTAILRNITKQKENQQRIEYLSYHDQLTGLYNRRYFDEELNRLDKERNLPLSIIVIDVNGLKLVNDAFGHIKGDILLQKVAEVLKRQCRSDEIISRIGGDEFVILLPETEESDTEKIAERIMSDMEGERLDDILISASVGWFTKKEVSEQMNDIFINAENRMYKRKLTESQNMRIKTVDYIFDTLVTIDGSEKKEAEKIADLSKKISVAMGFDDEKIKEIEFVAKRHDIGNIAIKRDLLVKKDRLSDIEFDEIKKHTESGYQILKSVDLYSSFAESILSHHERWDGSGYPRGLKKESIPIASRIIAVSDAYVAMTSNRPYRKPVSKEDAIEEIKKSAGRQFDPSVVEVFVKKVAVNL